MYGWHTWPAKMCNFCTRSLDVGRVIVRLENCNKARVTSCGEKERQRDKILPNTDRVFRAGDHLLGFHHQWGWPAPTLASPPRNTNCRYDHGEVPWTCASIVFHLHAMRGLQGNRPCSCTIMWPQYHTVRIPRMLAHFGFIRIVRSFWPPTIYTFRVEKHNYCTP